MNDLESIDDYYKKIIVIVNSLKYDGKYILDVEVMDKILRTLPSKFEHIVCVIEESKDLSIMTIEEFVGFLQSYEH